MADRANPMAWPRSILCSVCKGSGMVTVPGYLRNTSEKCSTCNGIGRMVHHEDGVIIGVGVAKP